MRRFLGILLVLAWAACSSGGSGDAGLPPGVIARGMVTEVGSVTVADTTYDDSAATLDLDSAGAIEVGMKVTIEGTRSGDSGVADRVVYDADLVGPIEDVTPVESDFDGNPLVSELTILGQTVEVERDVTVFAAGVDFDTLAAGDLVEVSGFRMATDLLVATRVLRVTPAAMVPAMPDVELEGEVTNLISASFDVGKIHVDFAGDAPAEGDFVEVAGVFDGVDRVDTTSAGGRIEIQDPALAGSRADVEMEGVVSDFVDLGDFELDGQPVDGNVFPVFYEPDTGFVEDGVRIDVEGRLEDGLLVAERVKFREPEVRIAAEIANAADVDASAGTLALLGAIDVEVIEGTTRFSANLPNGLADLVPGDFVVVRGVRVGDQPVRATHIAWITTAGVPAVRGRVEAFDEPAGFFTILGLDIDTGTGTMFQDFSGVSNESDFYAYLTSQVSSTSASANPLLDVKLDAMTLDFAEAVEREDD